MLELYWANFFAQAISERKVMGILNVFVLHVLLAGQAAPGCNAVAS